MPGSPRTSCRATRSRCCCSRKFNGQARHYDMAVDVYRAALAREPRNQQALTGLAMLYGSFGWPREAEALLKPAIRAAPDDAHLKVALAAAYTSTRPGTRRSGCCAEARRLAPDNVRSLEPPRTGL